MEWKNQLQEYKIINGKHPEKDWADSPAKIPAHITTFEEIERNRVTNKERKKALTRSNCHFRSEDSYDKAEWYTSRTKEFHSTWLRREVTRVGVPEMPTSGSAECPNYVAMVPPSLAEVQADKQLTKERKVALTRSSLYLKESSARDAAMYTSQTKADFPGPLHPTEVHRSGADVARPWNQDAKLAEEEARRSISPTRAAAYMYRQQQNATYRCRPDVRVPELPDSGCAENPTYVITERSAPSDIQRQKLVNAQRKKALTSSNIEIGNQDRRKDLQGTYSTEMLFSAHREKVINTHAERFPTLAKESRAKSIHGTLR
eukprot:jgi/Tetstr1/450214/TSEL_037252.t1